MANQHVAKTNNTYNIHGENNIIIFGKRNTQASGLATSILTNDVNKTVLLSRYTDNYTNNLGTTDTYIIPISRTVENNKVDHLEINKHTTLEGTVATQGAAILCAVVEDNNKNKKSVCFTTDKIRTGTVLNENTLTTSGKTSVGLSIETNISRYPGKPISLNIYDAYKALYNDGSYPVKLTSIELASLRTFYGDANARWGNRISSDVFSGLTVKNFTDTATSVTYDVNKNVISPDTSASHNVTIGQLRLSNGTVILNPRTAQIQLNSQNSDKGFN